MFVYYPSCTFRKILPDTAKTVIEFLKEDMTIAGCCRAKNVRRLFRLTGDEFVREVLDKYRSEDPAPASEICEQYDVSTHEITGRRWYKIRAKGVVPILEQRVEIQYYEKELMQHCWILFPGEDNQEERKIVVERLLK